MLSTVKVPSDPAQVAVNNVSFRVQLAGPAPRSVAVDTHRLRAARVRSHTLGAAGVGGAAGAAGAGVRRGHVVRSGHTGPEDTGAPRLLQTVRVPAAGLVPGVEPESANATTQILPRIEEPGRQPAPSVVAPRGPQPPETRQPGSAVHPAPGTYDDPFGDGPGGLAGPHGDSGISGDSGWQGPELPAESYEDAFVPRRSDSVRHAYYPGRRMNLGVVLLPLRIFLGFISVYAGITKLCDPVYFDGGVHGSMVTWLHSLQPWTLAAPLHDFALAHPVGAGLTVAFLQVIVGVLTICGLWQRLAAGIGGLLSLALIVTVGWRTVAVYDAPDIIYLAAWSPLIIAGAPVYSMDSRLAGEAWRTLGPRVGIGDLRRRVLRRGAILATVIVGLALLVGALLGGAVRSAKPVHVPEPGEPPTNHLPGSPMPDEPDRTPRSSQSPGTKRDAGTQPSPSASSPESPSAADTGPTTPSGQETGGAPERTSAPVTPEQPPVPSTSGPAASGGGSTGGGSSSGGPNGGSPSGGSSEGGGRGGALGGLLG